MSLATLLIAFSFLLLLGCRDKRQNSVSFEEKQKQKILQQKIKSSSECEFKYHYGKLADTCTKIASVEYDKSANKIQEYDNIFFKTTTHFKYNSANQLQEELMINLDGSFDRRITYRYDANGYQIEMTIYAADSGILVNNVFRYDSLGNQVEHVFYNSDGIIENKSIYKYDNFKNRIEWTELDSIGKIKFKETTIYNSNNNPISTVNKDEKGKVKVRYQYKYDSKNNQIEMIKTNAVNKVDYSYKYKYDGNGNQIEWINLKADNTIDYKYSYKYDKNNNEIERTEFNNLNEPLRLIKISYEHF
jgi:hypothetical protein